MQASLRAGSYGEPVFWDGCTPHRESNQDKTPPGKVLRAVTCTPEYSFVVFCVLFLMRLFPNLPIQGGLSKAVQSQLGSAAISSLFCDLRVRMPVRHDASSGLPFA